MSVAVRELKASLSRVLSRAQHGEIIEVTSHNKPIARIIGIPEQAEAGLRRLIASGAVSWGGGKPRQKSPVQLTSRDGWPRVDALLNCEDRCGRKLWRFSTGSFLVTTS